MQSRYYYAFEDPLAARSVGACSRAEDDLPLAVNCAGNLLTALPFATDNTAGREDFYLLYVASGRMKLWLPEGETTAASGSLVLFPPKFSYRYTYEGGAPLSYFWVHFTGSYALRFLKEIGFSTLPCLHTVGRDDHVVSAFHTLFGDFERKSHLQTHELAASLQTLLLAASLSVSRGEGRTLERSVGYIHSAYNTDIRIPDLARMENLSNSRYIAVFDKQMGTSPSAYIIRLRMSAARDLLHGTDMSIQQIGALVGYRDPHFFSRVFKKQVGVSPKAYRSATQGCK